MPESKDILSDYEEMLDLAYSKIQSNVTEHKRFEVPNLKHAIIGRRGPTVLYNFKEICDTLNRDPATILKFLSKELGTPGTLRGSSVTFKGRFDHGALKRLIDRYVRDFVTCPVCKSPDTHIVKEKRLRFLRCDACGAKSPVKPH
jgi:translation initiation factor 2 subunit 2